MSASLEQINEILRANFELKRTALKAALAERDEALATAERFR